MARPLGRTSASYSDCLHAVKGGTLLQNLALRTAHQHRGHKNTNPHARGRHSQGDGRSSFGPAAPPLPPPVSTSGPPQFETLPCDPDLQSQVLVIPFLLQCTPLVLPPNVTRSVPTHTPRNTPSGPDASRSTPKMRHGPQTESNPNVRQPETFDSH